MHQYQSCSNYNWSHAVVADLSPRFITGVEMIKYDVYYRIKKINALFGSYPFKFIVKKM